MLFLMRVPTGTISLGWSQWWMSMKRVSPDMVNGPGPGIDWLHWGHEHTAATWAFYQLEARELWQVGRRRQALEHLELAEAHARQLDQLLKTRALRRAFAGVMRRERRASARRDAEPRKAP